MESFNWLELKFPDRFPFRKANFVYTLGVIVVFLVVVAFVWFFNSQILGLFQGICRTLTYNAGAADDKFVASDQFVTNLFFVSLIISLLGLGIWVYENEQRNSGVVG